MELEYRSGNQALLWKQSLAPVYLFFGEEDRLKQEAVDALTKHIVTPDFADFDMDVLDGGNTTADAILASAGQVAFGSEKRLVVVRGMEQWRDRNRQTEVERLAEGLSRLGAATCLVLVAAAEEDEGRRKTAVSTKLDNAVKRLGVLVTCPALKGEGLSHWVVARVQEQGKKIEPLAAHMLIDTVGNEMMILEHEITKLICYVGERNTILAKDVGIVSASSPEDVVFALIDAIAKRDTDKALQLLLEVHRYDPKPQAVAGKLLALLSRQYRLLWQAKQLASRRIQPRDVRNLPEDVRAELPSEGTIMQVSFKAGEIFAMAREYTFAELASILERLLLCDLANKGNVLEDAGAFGSDPEGNLKLLVLLLTGATEKRVLPQQTA